MGDRNNPIKFGPEWLRNLARERSAADTVSSANSQASSLSSATTTASGSAAGASGSSSSSATASSSVSNTSTSNSPGATAKVQLAKLRYGREEMLALYDRTSEAPSELKYIDFLYQPRGKPPFALNNSFEDEMSGNTRSSVPMGTSGERFGIARGMGRTPNISDGRGRPRMPFVRQASTGRGISWHMGAPRMLYNTNADEESPQRSSWSATNGGNATNRNTGEQAEWNGNKMFRSKRQGQATNWRQSREENDEWRSSDTSRSRSNNQQEKWERDWGDRPNQEKSQSWNSNRRTWVGSESQNNDDLPEWAVDNAEACGGTFDSSGAFHGYSNDDTNLPKNQESSYPLARSHTHGSFARSKTVEEGSDEWWASEKAKKLSPKRFDASDIKFKKPSTILDSSTLSHLSTKASTLKEDVVETPEKTEPAPDLSVTSTSDDEKIKKKPKFSESKTFDALMRSDINLEEANDERGNFQSVMITPNNSLRQKHQNIVATAEVPNRKSAMYHLLPSSTSSKYNDNDYDSRAHSSNEEKIVEELMDMTLEDKEIISLTKMPVTTASTMMNPPSVSMPSGMPPNVNSMPQMPNSAMHMRMSSPLHANQVLTMNKPNMPNVMQAPSMQTSGIQQVGITNSALNASLGLPIGSPGGAIGLPMQAMPPPMLAGMTNPGMGGMDLPAGMGGGPMQSNNSAIPFPTGAGIPGLSTSNMANTSLFLNQNTSNNTMPNHGNQGNMFPMHGLQHSGSQAPFGASIYGNMMQTSPPQPPQNAQNLSEQWYYEDPKKTIQGPFSSKEMYNWYRAGFFTPSLMVRRACDTHMRPLGSYGPTLPFAQVEMMSPYPLSSPFEPRSQGPRDNMMNPQPGLGLESVMNLNDNPTMDGVRFGTGQPIRNAPFRQPPPMVDSLWSPPTPAPDMLWMQQALNTRNETRVNNLPVYFWDQQPTAMTSSNLLPEEIAKEMKTEDQILAQMRASQNINTHPNMPYMNEPPPPATHASTKPEDSFPATENATPNLEELQKLMHKDIMIPKAAAEPSLQNKDTQAKVEKAVKMEQTIPEPVVNKTQIQNKITIDPKAAKQAKNENEKAKSKENVTKTKTKKVKDDKKEEIEMKNEDEPPKAEKRSEESSPSKSKKEEKVNKKEIEKEKKEWLKDGFTIVKGSEKNNSKENKKKVDEAKAIEEAERKRKEEDKVAADEEKKRKQIEALKKQQEQQLQQQQRQISESVVKKAPWSAVANQSMQATNKDGLTLGEIQRLEREKKLEQIKEQQQMMQIIAQQQAAALAREQEMQAGLGWAKKKGANTMNMPGQSLAEIQAEARKQQAAAAAGAAAAASQALEEAQAAQQVQINLVPWGNTHNGGFWDTQPNAIPKPIEKPQEPIKAPELKPKKKPTVIITAKKESSPAVEFETWCTTVLASYSSKIDVPTFVGFLKDIESPYEVKDYVKCYLGESKDSGDFARQFLERRSKLLRVGMVTPSDDLCSPAMAVNPRTISGSDYQEVKGKGKKTKKNKMLKVDARILGFSVTASEDRINVGDIDTV